MDKKINILYIFHISEIGGGSFCLLNIIKRLDTNCFNPIVLLKNKGALSIELEKIGATVFIEKSVSTVLYNKSIFKRSSIQQIYSLVTSISKVKNWIRKTNADIVHLNTMMLYPYLWPAHQLKIKTVIHMREHWPKNEHQVQFQIAKKIINRYADKIVAINQTSASILGLPKKTDIIYDLIDFENRDEKLDLNKLLGNRYNEIKYFIFFGGLSKIKGILEVVDTFSNVICSKDIRLILLGIDDISDNEKGYKGKLKKILSYFEIFTYYDKVKYKIKKDRRIILLPNTYKIKSLIEQSYCVLSYHTIPHASLPLAEALYLGKPVIAANTPEALNYSNNGDSALLFKMNDKKDFKDKILFALENEKYINIKAQASIIKIRDQFDPIRNSNLLEDIYKNLKI